MRARASRFGAPAAPATFVERTAVLGALRAGADHRLTVVVAGPGYGKSTLVAAWASQQRATWYTLDAGDRDLATLVKGLLGALRTRLPSLSEELVHTSGTLGPDGDALRQAGAVVDELAQALARARARRMLLVLDDLHVLEALSPSARVVEGLCRQAPGWLHLVLCSREDPPFPIARLRGQGEVLDVDAAALSFRVEETRALLATVAGHDAASHAAAVQEVTGGWPVAVRLAAEALATVPPGGREQALAQLRQPGGRLLDYLAEEVMTRCAPELAELVRAVAPFPRFSAGLCQALGVAATPDTLADLARRGLFVEPHGSVAGWFTLHGLVREYALQHMRPEPPDAGDRYRIAARWLESEGHLVDALQALAAADQPGDLAGFLARRGQALNESGAATALLAAAGSLPAELRTGPVGEVIGAAHHARGEWDEALVAFRQAGEAGGPLTAGTAWRMGLIHHLRGHLDQAVATYQRGDGGDLETGGKDAALLLAWTAAAHWLRGEEPQCRALASKAMRVAERSGDDRALAAAHTALALVAAVDGDRAANDTHYLRALGAAEEAGDTLQLIRIRANRGSRFLEEGAYDEALNELDLAVRAGELTGFEALLGLAQSNRAEVHLRQGRLDDAQADYEAAVRTYQRASSRLVSLPLAGLGDIHRQRGQLVRARAAYGEALRLAEAQGDMQALVTALAGLARATVADDPDEAAGLAGRAVQHATGPSEVEALLAAGWVAFARDERSAARGYAGDALARAAAQRNRPGMAEALMLTAVTAEERQAAARALDEAAALWQEVANPLGSARTALLRARLAGGRHASAEAAHAEAQLRRLGVPAWGEFETVLEPVGDRDAPPVSVCSLGGFRVLRHGQPVPLPEWGSRKARDLLKMLLTRRGRPAPRGTLCELLWPDARDSDLSARLSVLLSTLRGVLDPERVFDPDHFVRADHTSLSLDLDHVTVDVEEFLAVAREGLARQAAGDTGRAEALLVAADALFRGDFLEEDPYADWAVTLREEARVTALAVARARARQASAIGDHDGAISALLRVIARDPYDEGAHLALVRTLVDAGRHGEAHRRYRLYLDRMADLEVEASPFPA